MIAAAAELVAAENDVAAADARLRPKVLFRTGLSSPLSDSDSKSITAGIVVEHSFFDGGRRKSQVEVRQEELQSLRGDFEDKKRVGQADIEASLAQYRSTRSSLSLIAQQIEVTRAETESIESQLGSGQSNLQQFVEAQIRNYQAEAKQLDLTAEQRELEVRLGASTGRLMQNLQLDVDDILSVPLTSFPG